MVILRQANVNNPDFLELFNQPPAIYIPFVLRRDSEGYYLLPHFERGGFKNFGTYRMKESSLCIGNDFLIDIARRIVPEGWILEDEDICTTTTSSNPIPLAEDNPANGIKTFCLISS